MNGTEPTEDVHSLELDFAKHPNTDAFVPLCEAYLRQKRYMEAMLVCKKGIKNLPNDPRGRLLLAKTYFEQGKPPKAEQELSTLLEVFPDNIDALLMQSELYKQGGRKSDAIASLQRALALQPGRSDVKDSLRGLGVDVDTPPPPPPMQQFNPMQQMGGAVPQQAALGVGSFFEEAQPVQEPLFQQPMQPRPAQDFGRDFDAAPRRPQKRKKRGSGKVTLAIIAVLFVGFAAFLAFYLNHVGNVKKIDALVREARPHFERATYVSYKQALEKYKEILAIDAKNVYALSISAYVNYLLAQGQLVPGAQEQADKFFTAALAGSPEDENQYRVASKGWQKISAGDPKGAIALLAPEAPKVQSAHVYLTMVEAYAQMGEDAMARDAVTKATGIAATDNAVLVRTGENNLDEGKYEAAKGYFDQLLNNEAGHPGALIGRVFANIGKKQEALESAEKDLEKLSITPAEYMTPRWKAGVAWGKGLLELRRGRTAEAAKLFDEALKLDPSNLRHFSLRAKVYAASGMWNEAVKDYQTVLAKRPNHRVSQVGLALAYSTLGKSVEAGQIVEQLLAKDPNDAELQLVKARALRTQGKYDDAIAAYQKVLALQKTNFDAKIEQGQALRMKKDYAKAQEYLTELAKDTKGRSNALAQLELGRVYLDQGQTDKAKAAIEEAIKKDPDYPDTYFFYGKSVKAKVQKEAFSQYLKMAPSGTYAAEAQKLLRK